jgi:hypothetical protein
MPFCAKPNSWPAKLWRPNHVGHALARNELRVGHVILGKPKCGWDPNYYPAYGQWPIFGWAGVGINPNEPIPGAAPQDKQPAWVRLFVSLSFQVNSLHGLLIPYTWSLKKSLNSLTTVFYSLTHLFSLDTSHQAVANLAWHLHAEGVNLTPTKPIRNTDKMPQYKGPVRTDGADNLG